MYTFAVTAAVAVTAASAATATETPYLPLSPLLPPLQRWETQSRTLILENDVSHYKNRWTYSHTTTCGCLLLPLQPHSFA
jgi:hypothetical protein